MAQKEIWFQCPVCTRPIRVAGKFIGATFVHPPCGATVRAPDPAKGRPDVELISAPESYEAEGVKPAQIDKVESQGLFVPRHLREGGEGGGGGAPEVGVGAPAGEEDVQALAEKIARALLEKQAAGAGDSIEAEAGAGPETEETAIVFDEEEEAAPSNVDPIREKASRMGFGNGPVDTEALRKQFNKSLDVLKDGAEDGGGESDILASKAPLSAELEARMVKDMTPWEADPDEQAPAGRAGPGTGGLSKKTVLVSVAIAVAVVLVGAMIAKLLRDDKHRDDPVDQPIRPRSSSG